VLRGKQGTGKGCFVSQYGRVYGGHFLHVTNQNQLTGRFNSHLKDALLVFCDEGIWAGDRTAEGVLKAMITEPVILCEPKGKDAFAVKNHINLVVASNSSWVIPAGLEERRFLVLDVSDKYMQDHAYFGAIFHQMNHGGREALLYDLLEMDTSAVDLRKIPRTAALLDQIIHTMPTVHKFWFERLRAGTLIDEHREWEPYVITEKLYEAYLKFSENCGERYRLINRQFGKELRRLCPDVKRGHRTIDSREKWILYVPELETCREKFENIVKVKVNWKAEVDENDLPF
jgi:phage/plasmid-associated DNA primase